jgi:anti-sigma B factor antagonist
MRPISRLQDGAVIVEPAGQLDIFTVDQFRDVISGWIDNGHTDIWVNLDGLDFMDSSGLGALVGTLKRLRAHDGSLQLVCTKPSLLRLFTMTGLHKVFAIHPSVPPAPSPSATRSRPTCRNDT